MITKIETVLKNTLPSMTYITVEEGVIMGESYYQIMFAASNYNINGMNNQCPQIVSLNLDKADLELSVQKFHMMGGQTISLVEQKCATFAETIKSGNCKVPFRKPKKTELAVLKAIEKFAQNWLKGLTVNRERLRHQNIVDYDAFLAS